MNTTITINYADGTERRYTVADTLEQRICEGDMFSISTMHPCVSEMVQCYGGNPMAALGLMMLLRATLIRDQPDDVDSMCTVVNQCIEFLADELSSVAKPHGGALMKSRTEVIDFINSGGTEPTEAKGASHFGKIELRKILDFIYEGEPLCDDEKLHSLDEVSF